MKRGFTLIELMITIGIMTIISGIVFYNFPKLNQTVLLNRAARELTLALREAQSRATAVAQLPGASAGDKFPNNYGVHFKGGESTFFLFNDKDPNPADSDPLGDLICKMAGGVSCDDPAVIADENRCDGECVKRFTFTHGVKIGNIVASWSGCVADPVNVLFYRPDPTTRITNETGTPPCSIANPSEFVGPLKISISRANPSGAPETRTINLWTTGQISISNP